MQELRKGSLLQGGKYRIEKVLGQGGFGITYLAEQVVLHRKVAIKEFFMKEYCERDDSTSQVTLGTTSGSKDLVLRFRGKFIREAQMIASLEHPNIVKIHDIFEENGTAYYVMPYLGSESLSDQVKKNGSLPERDALRYIRQVSSALSYIHGRNSLHFDVKPSNILVNNADEAILIDFGISKHYDESGSQTSSSPVGVSKGYAPLEQYQQNEISSFTPATDIYALGATLLALLTGVVPPSASEVNEEGLPPISTKISKTTRDAIIKAMQPRRKDRPQNIKEFLELIDGELDDPTTIVDNPKSKLFASSEVNENDLTVTSTLEQSSSTCSTRKKRLASLTFDIVTTKKEYLLLLFIPFGMLLSNIPSIGFFHLSLWNDEFLNPCSPFFHSYRHVLAEGGLLDVLYIGVKVGVYPCLILLGVGAMTDFGPLIANPKSMLWGAVVLLGIFGTFMVTQMEVFGFILPEAGSIGLIGGADGSTAIFLTSMLAPHLLGPIAVAAYSNMVLAPLIQPLIMRALTTKKERKIRMPQLRTVSKKERVLFPVLIALVVSLVLPHVAVLIGSLMFGNLMKECGVLERLRKSILNVMYNIVVIFLGITLGATALHWNTILFLCIGIVTLGMMTAGGVSLAKFMNLFLKDKINPLIGSAGVCAGPLAARISHREGVKADPHNCLLAYALGPNAAGVIGSIIGAGIFLFLLG